MGSPELSRFISSPDLRQDDDSKWLEITSRLFDRKILQDDQLLDQFFNQMPLGGNLHMHFEGCVSAIDYLNFAANAGLLCCYEEKERKFVFFKDGEYQNKEGECTENPVGTISAKLIQSDSLWEEKFMNTVGMRGDKKKNKTSGHALFFSAFETLESIGKYMPLKNKIESILNNNAEHNMDYMELSVWFPRAQPLPQEYLEKFEILFNEGNVKGLLALLYKDNWMKNYTDKVKDELNSCNKVTDDKLLKRGFNQDNIWDIENPIVLRCIMDHGRTEPSLAKVFASIAAGVVLAEDPELRDWRIVGNGLSGREENSHSTNNLIAHMKMFTMLREVYPDAKYTIHCGEFNNQLAGSEVKARHIRETVKAKPNRLSHLICISSLGRGEFFEILENFRENGIHYEVCLESNKQILRVYNGDHPFPWFVEYGVSFSLCTDDETVLHTSLSNEMKTAAIRYNSNKEHKVSSKRRMSYFQFKRSVLNSIEASFLPGESLYKNSQTKEPIELFKDLRSSKQGELTSDQKEFLAKSDKAKMIFRVERKFTKFQKEDVSEMLLHLRD